MWKSARDRAKSKMRKDCKLNKLLKWIFRARSIGYKSLPTDTNSVNSLSLLIDMNNKNIKVIENQSLKDKQTNQRKFNRRRKKLNATRKSIEQTPGYLDQSMFRTSNQKRKFTLKNDFVEQLSSTEEYQNYLDKLWTPKVKKLSTVDLLSLDAERQHRPDHPFEHKSDIVNLLLDSKECSICEHDLNDYESLEIMPCSCVFHLYCISSHLLIKKICPFCFQIFTKKQITSYNRKWRQRYWLS